MRDGLILASLATVLLVAYLYGGWRYPGPPSEPCAAGGTDSLYRITAARASNAMALGSLGVAMARLRALRHANEPPAASGEERAMWQRRFDAQARHGGVAVVQHLLGYAYYGVNPLGGLETYLRGPAPALLAAVRRGHTGVAYAILRHLVSVAYVPESDYEVAFVARVPAALKRLKAYLVYSPEEGRMFCTSRADPGAMLGTDFLRVKPSGDHTHVHSDAWRSLARCREWHASEGLAVLKAVARDLELPARRRWGDDRRADPVVGVGKAVLSGGGVYLVREEARTALEVQWE